MMPGIMTKKHKDALKTHLPTLTENLHLTAGFWSFLVTDKVCSISDKQAIENGKSTEGDRVFELVALLMKRPDRCYKKFVEALRRTDQEHLAALLEVKMTNKARKNTKRTTTSLVETREDVEDFIKNKVKYIPVNAEYCDDSWCFFMGNLLELRDEYETERGTTVQMQLFEDIVTSTGITFCEDHDDLGMQECKICYILENKTGTDNSGSYKQQLENHLKAVKKVNDYCIEVSQREAEQEELVLYTGLAYDGECNLIYASLFNLSGKAEKHYMWEEIKAGCGTHEFLSCLYHYISNNPIVNRIVLVTVPHGGILRNSKILLFFLNLMSRSLVSEVQVVYAYAGYHEIIHRSYFVETKAQVIARKFGNQNTEKIKSLEDIIKEEADESVVHMKAENMFRFPDVLKTLNIGEIQGSLNITRWLLMRRSESDCIVRFANHIQETVEEGDIDYTTRVCVSLPQAQAEFPPLYPDGFRVPVEMFKEIKEDASDYGENWKDYYQRQTHIDKSCTEKILPHPGIIIQETDGLSESDL